jgi:hypothetical protein
MPPVAESADLFVKVATPKVELYVTSRPSVAASFSVEITALEPPEELLFVSFRL